VAYKQKCADVNNKLEHFMSTVTKAAEQTLGPDRNYENPDR